MIHFQLVSLLFLQQFLILMFTKVFVEQQNTQYSNSFKFVGIFSRGNTESLLFMAFNVSVPSLSFFNYVQNSIVEKFSSEVQAYG